MKGAEEENSGRSCGSALCFIVLARWGAASSVTSGRARRIAANIAKLPGLLRISYKHSARAPSQEKHIGGKRWSHELRHNCILTLI
jgi:hypothetical protein